jgi:hypothetical protein
MQYSSDSHTYLPMFLSQTDNFRNIESLTLLAETYISFSFDPNFFLPGLKDGVKAGGGDSPKNTPTEEDPKVGGGLGEATQTVHDTEHLNSKKKYLWSL